MKIAADSLPPCLYSASKKPSEERLSVMTKPLDGKLALVTGASRGFGAAAAVRLAQEGAHVIITARTQGGLEETDDAINAVGGGATLAPLDLMEMDKIDLVAASIHQRFDRLDILVGAAAQLGGLSPVHHITPKAWERTMALNVTVNYRLIRAFDPLLRRSEAGRALFLTHDVATVPKAYWALHAASKAALEALVKSYALEVQRTPIKARIYNPGPMSTKMRAEAYPGEAPNSQPHPSERTDGMMDLIIEDAAPRA